ncbi:protein of unknown function [Vibrio tapetis subsp. tapetis]|uniref:Uncharacterized protein n=1 Tax=Vibrio tapetis subsp. tapetis TaxID=1671868 RepID=A0A2N8Z9I4_9VIBR|nr:protein of unknown function [Vibrio tapetis subsp. tapetis]
MISFASGSNVYRYELNNEFSYPYIKLLPIDVNIPSVNGCGVLFYCVLCSTFLRVYG